MDRDLVVQLRTSFEAMVRQHTETGTEFWCARDLQMLLGYANWENFAKVIEKAITSCKTAGHAPSDHFLEVGKMVEVGSARCRPQ
jgi:DNA-damage-inducible protein D